MNKKETKVVKECAIRMACIISCLEKLKETAIDDETKQLSEKSLEHVVTTKEELSKIIGY